MSRGHYKTQLCMLNVYELPVVCLWEACAASVVCLWLGYGLPVYWRIVSTDVDFTGDATRPQI